MSGDWYDTAKKQMEQEWQETQQAKAQWQQDLEKRKQQLGQQLYQELRPLFYKLDVERKLRGIIGRLAVGPGFFLNVSGVENGFTTEILINTSFALTSLSYNDVERLYYAISQHIVMRYPRGTYESWTDTGPGITGVSRGISGWTPRGSSGKQRVTSTYEGGTRPLLTVRVQTLIDFMKLYKEIPQDGVKEIVVKDGLEKEWIKRNEREQEIVHSTKLLNVNLNDPSLEQDFNQALVQRVERAKWSKWTPSQWQFWGPPHDFKRPL